MKRILVYGDSNSWGFPNDGSGRRMKDRWPQVMARHLDGVEVIEENLPGRTTVHDDPEFMGETCNGLRPLQAILLSHAPVDAVIFLLGTNDLKARFDPDADTIAANIGQLITATREIGGASPVWEDPQVPDIYVLCPPVLSDRADDPDWERVTEWQGGRVASQNLWEALRKTGEDMGVPTFDTDHFVEGGAEDPIHWTEASHLRLGQAVAHWIASHQ